MIFLPKAPSSIVRHWVVSRFGPHDSGADTGTTRMSRDNRQNVKWVEVRVVNAPLTQMLI